jgi:hypothetical protein
MDGVIAPVASMSESFNPLPIIILIADEARSRSPVSVLAVSDAADGPLA